MKRRLNLLTILLGIFVFQVGMGQDTVVVQTLTFDDITKRRDVYSFPDGTEQYRKILMSYTLKCDPRTTADGFNCGEWDYLSYNQIYDHNATYDSSYRSHPSFLVNGQERESYSTHSEKVYDHTLEQLSGIEHTMVNSLTSGEIGTGTTTNNYPFNSTNTGSKTYILIKSDELIAAGLSAGDITGLQFNFEEIGNAAKSHLIDIEIAPTTLTDIKNLNLFNTNFNKVYRYTSTFTAAGWIDFQFKEPLNWNGTSNILVAVSTDSNLEDEMLKLKSDPEATTTMVEDGQNYALDFNGAANYVDLGRALQISGNSPRTIEAWAYTRSFNGGGIFQAGSTGATDRDFSFRTLSQERWRLQVWGGNDYDITLPGSGSGWHHYAIVYDGSSARIYYDGQLQQSIPMNLNTGEINFRLGTWSGRYFDGLIDDVRVWNAALTSTIIRGWMSRKVTSDHPFYSNLKGYYDLNEGEGFEVEDQSPSAQENGVFVGNPWWTPFRGSEMLNNFIEVENRPQMMVEMGDYVSNTIQTQHLDSTLRRSDLLQKFDNPANGTIIDDDAPDHPNMATSNEVVWEGGTYSYTYDKETGNKIDSSLISIESTLTNTTKEWYSPTVVYEIGRFITPYGIGLDLGPEGFNWTYDVTDYKELLKGDVELSAGNNQELIDLKFIFIKGTPPREVKHIKQIWGPRRSYSYRALDNDEVLSPTAVQLHPEASQWKVKTRITGHGHNSTDGNYPHCCEWKDNTHFLAVNGAQTNSWHIWQSTECANNPVYPQGGTWPGAREGWCPGDVVKDFEFEITDRVNGSEVTLDYAITPVPQQNQGMGSGNYVMAMQLVQYGDNSHNVDAEIYDIISPSGTDYFSRVNPTCGVASIVVRNNGSTALKTMDILYRIKGGEERTYNWNGTILPHEKGIIDFPVGENFWIGDTDNPEFYVQLANPNGSTDLYPDNDKASSKFVLPTVFTDPIEIRLVTNNRAFDNTLVIKDVDGNVVLQWSALQNNAVYSSNLDLPQSCYTMELLDTGNDGLSYWAFPAQGAGSLVIRNQNTGQTLLSFEPEFGRDLYFSFGIDALTDNQNPEDIEKNLTIFPNPVNEILYVELEGFNKSFDVEIFDMYGKRWQTLSMSPATSFEFPVHDLPAGSYILKAWDKETKISKRFIITH